MSRRRSRPREMNPSARFDLLWRVIVAAFTILSATRLIPDPLLLLKASGLALPEQANPRSQQPPRDQAAQTGKDRFPYKQRAQSIGNGAPHDRVADYDREETHPADHEKPPQPTCMVLNKPIMGA